ncbi:MAG: hypothetical protein ACXVRW_16020 [Solirubrobacteraceae bacterium]
MPDVTDPMANLHIVATRRRSEHLRLEAVRLAREHQTQSRRPPAPGSA